MGLPMPLKKIVQCMVSHGLGLYSLDDTAQSRKKDQMKPSILQDILIIGGFATRPVVCGFCGRGYR
jgi:hypothetical protein